MPGAVFSSARRLLFLYGCEDKLRYRLRSVLLPLFPLLAWHGRFDSAVVVAAIVLSKSSSWLRTDGTAR
jgi:hypothetical protein